MHMIVFLIKVRPHSVHFADYICQNELFEICLCHFEHAGRLHKIQQFKLASFFIGSIHAVCYTRSVSFSIGFIQYIMRSVHAWHNTIKKPIRARLGVSL
jgi:hypothetical protein